MEYKVGKVYWSARDGFHELKDRDNKDGGWSFTHGTGAYTKEGKSFIHDAHRNLFTVEEAALLGFYPEKKMTTKTLYKPLRKTHTNTIADINEYFESKDALYKTMKRYGFEICGILEVQAEVLE